jgi:hypothetical protein
VNRRLAKTGVAVKYGGAVDKQSADTGDPAKFGSVGGKARSREATIMHSPNNAGMPAGKE